MQLIKVKYICIASLLSLTFSANAYEYENASPLFIGAELANQEIGKTTVELSGREVSIKVDINNEAKNYKRIGFVASTKFFDQLGDGETHQDKTFSDLKVSFNDKPIKPVKNERGYFLGQDITGRLRKVGLSPLPNNNASQSKIDKLPKQLGMPISNWQGYVSYAWGLMLNSRSKNTLNINYRALPEFFLEDVSDDRLTQQVLQHCGKPDEVRQYLNSIQPSTQVIVERYVIPLGFINWGKAKIKVTQPSKNWLQAKPLISLVCGLETPVKNNSKLDGDIGVVNQELSILVISQVADLSTSEHKND